MSFCPERKPILVTSALPYVNNEPHLGNLIGCVLSADVYARWSRTKRPTLFVCGTDEYGTATEMKAREEGVSCKALCAKYRELHKEIYDWFNISFDVFGQTPTESQTDLVHGLIKTIDTNGFLKEKTTEQAYSPSMDMFLADRFLVGNCHLCGALTRGDQCESCHSPIDPHLLENPRSVLNDEVPVFKPSSHLYLNLPSLKDVLESNLESLVTSSDVRSITRAWIDSHLEDRCISRDLRWGTSIPPDLREGRFSSKVLYVWFDAPLGYLSILKHARLDWEEWIPPRADWALFMAKDNVPFHTIVFPATLHAGGWGDHCPTHLSSVHYLSFEGQKFSKSKGVGLFGSQAQSLSRSLGIGSDYWRYYLLKIRPEARDSDFTYSGFEKAISNLADNFGNFSLRILSLAIKLVKKTSNPFFPYDSRDEGGKELTGQILSFQREFDRAMKDFSLRKALEIAEACSSFGNTFVQKTQPWTLAEEERRVCLGKAFYILDWCKTFFRPFIPQSIEILDGLLKQIGQREKSFIL